MDPWWRCISYITWGNSIAMLIYQSVMKWNGLKWLFGRKHWIILVVMYFINNSRVLFFLKVALTYRAILMFMACTWRIIPVSKWLVTSIYKPFRPFGRGTTPLMRLNNYGPVINHLLNGMILQVMKLNLDIFISIYHQILVFFPFWEDEESVFCSSTLIIRSLSLTIGSRSSGAVRSFLELRSMEPIPYLQQIFSLKLSVRTWTNALLKGTSCSISWFSGSVLPGAFLLVKCSK